MLKFLSQLKVSGLKVMDFAFSLMLFAIPISRLVSNELISHEQPIRFQ